MTIEDRLWLTFNTNKFWKLSVNEIMMWFSSELGEYISGEHIMYNSSNFLRTYKSNINNRISPSDKARVLLNNYNNLIFKVSSYSLDMLQDHFIISNVY